MSQNFEENTYSCDICETNYDNPNDIVDHNTDIHPNNEYYLCDQCEYEAISQSLLQEHITATHVHLSCDYCGFVAKNRGGLTRHVNAKHENANESEKHKTAEHENLEEKERVDFTATVDTEEPSCHREREGDFLYFNFPIQFPSTGNTGTRQRTDLVQQ